MVSQTFFGRCLVVGLSFGMFFTEASAAVAAKPVVAIPSTVLKTASTASQTTASTFELLKPDDIVPEILNRGLRPTVKKVAIKKLLRLGEKEDQYYLGIKIGAITHGQFVQTRTKKMLKPCGPFKKMEFRFLPTDGIQQWKF